MKIQTASSVLSASLPMYDWPEVQVDNDKFWTTLRQALMDYGFQRLPQQLDRQGERPWSDGNIGLTQTCGFPLKHTLGNMVELVGTPMYAADYCQKGFYASVILVRQDDVRITIDEFQGAMPAINGLNSQSGYNALRNLIHSMKQPSITPFFSAPLISGGHRQSIKAVALAQADLCASDPVSWKLAQRFLEEAAQLRVLCHTPYTPALPLVCSSAIAQEFSGSLGDGPTALRQTIIGAWQEAIRHDSITATNLLFEGITTIEREAYLGVPTLNYAL